MPKIDSTKYSAQVANAVSQVKISSTVFKAFIADVKDVVDQNSPEGTYAADAGATDTYAVTLAPVPIAYYTGMVVRFKANTLNTGAATLNVNSLGAKSIVKSYNSALTTGDILANQIVEVVYDGTNFQLFSVPSNLANKTQEALISAALLNGWTSASTGVKYAKNDLGIVTLTFSAVAGTIAAGTGILTLPTGYMPVTHIMLHLFDLSLAQYNGSALLLQNDGNLFVVAGSPALTAGRTYTGGVTFYAG